MIQIAVGFFNPDEPQPKDPRKGLNGLRTKLSDDGSRLSVHLIRFGKPVQFWSFYNDEGLNRMDARYKAESIVRARLLLEE